MSKKRKSIPEKVRFEVFKRDSFKCQYCGKSSPDVVLHVDHIKPVAEGGTNDISNLLAACSECNWGKGATLLEDNTVIEKQRKQLEELNERRKQLEMMLAWREELLSFEDDKANVVRKHWNEKLNGYGLNESGLQDIKKMLKKYPINIILDSIDDATEQYLVMDADELHTPESVHKTWTMIPRFCNNKQRDKDKPYLKDLYYIRGILKNRLSYFEPTKSFQLLEAAYLHGASIESLKEFAIEVRNWTQFKSGIESFLDKDDE
jgi:hypothetical protein